MDPIDVPRSQLPAPAKAKGRRLHATLVAGGAALGMTLAGLGIAGAQTDQGGSTGTTAQAERDRPPGARGHCGPGLAVAAQAIGISEADLRNALRSGQSIAQVAQSRNVEVQKVVDALVADARAGITAKVQAGELTQAQADARLSGLNQRITEMVNRAGGPGPGPGGPRDRGPDRSPPQGS